MPKRFQYQGETGPVTPLPALVPKLSWLGQFAAIVPTVAVLTAACASTQGNASFVDFPIPVVQGPVGSPHPLGRKVRYQYQETVSPVLIPAKIPKLGWSPDYPAINPWSPVLPTACISASGQFGHPEFWPTQTVITIARAYFTTILEDHPVGYWRMDAASGTSETDRSVSGYIGTYTASGVTLAQSGALADGDTAVLFNGSTGRLDANGSALKLNSAWSAECWIKTASSIDALIFGTFSAPGWAIMFAHGGKARVANFTSGSSSIFDFVGTAFLNDGNWHHIAVTYDLAHVCLYVDGILDITQTATTVPNASQTAVGIGGQAGGGNFFTGTIDECACYAYGLSAQQVANHYALRLPSTTSSTYSLVSLAGEAAWKPDYPDTAPGKSPNTWSPSYVLGFPFTLLPTNPAFLSWEPEYQSLVWGRKPLPVDAYSNWEAGSFYDATQSGSATSGIVLINGIDRTTWIDTSSVNIDDYLNEQPNTARLRVRPGAPFTLTGGESVLIALGNTEPINRKFLGTVVTVQQIYLGGVRSNIAYDATCQDGTYKLNRRYPVKRYTSMDPGLIAIDLVNNFSTGFTTANVQTGFTPVSIDFDGSGDLVSCLTDLANLNAGYFYPDYTNDIHFFQTEAGSDPNPINETNALSQDGAHDIVFDKDLSQARTRVNVNGASTSVDLGTVGITLPITAVTIPLSTQAPYSASGGTAAFGPQSIAYTGIANDAGNGTLSSGVPQTPGSISSATQLTTSMTGPSGNSIGPSGNLGAGVFGYKVAYVNEKGDESEASAAVTTVTVSSVTAPGSISATQNSSLSGSLTNGTFNYKVSFKTGSGETLPGPTTSAILSAVSTAGVDVTLNGIPGSPGGLSVGTYGWKLTFKTSNGETALAGTGLTAQIFAINPVNTTTLISGGTAGAMTASTGYSYAMSFLDGVGETIAVGVGSISLGVGQHSVNMTVGASSDGRVTSRRIYRFIPASAQFQLVAEVPGNSSTSIIDQLADTGVSATVVSPTNTTGSGRISVSFPTSSDARVTGRNIYRTKVNGSTYYLVTSINDNTTTSFIDAVSDANLSATVGPSVNTAITGQIDLSNIPVSTDPRVVSREIYRTVANGGIFGRVASLTNLTVTNPFTGFPTPPATTFTDNVADTSLGALAPTVSTADNGVVYLTGIPLGPTTPVGTPPVSITQGRRIFRTEAGGSSYKLVAEIHDNVTTAFIDNVPDTSLGSLALVFSEWRSRVGDTLLYVEDLSKFTEASGQQWIKVNSQVILATGRSGSSGVGYLSGIPAGGVGSIVAQVTFETQVICMPFLKGVSGFIYPLNHGDSNSIRVTRNDLTAQALLAALEGGDGIHEFFITDSSIQTVAAANARGDAELLLFSNQLKTITYNCRDNLTRSGRTIVVSLGAPTNITFSAKIQHVNITQIGLLANKNPLYTVEASITKFSLQDALRRMTLT